MTAETEQVQHTPGPWILDATADGWVLLAPERYHDVCAFDATEEDARLIAAAPELLAALEPFAALWDTAFEDARDDRQVFGFNDNTFSVGDIRAAIAAIRKARGEE